MLLAFDTSNCHSLNFFRNDLILQFVLYGCIIVSPLSLDKTPPLVVHTRRHIM